MKSFIFFCCLNLAFSFTHIVGANAAAITEYDCEGEDTEHFFLATATFENQIMTLDMLQSTQHTEGPFPLLPLRYKLKDLQASIERENRVYKFSPGNYQDCDYRWLWPMSLGSEEVLTTLLKLNCDGVRSEVEMTCTRNE
ncbi:MAG: hypothetical protein AABY64_00920 [Bdellovibrionota bacterium]